MTQKKKIYFVSDVHLGAPALNNNREREILFASWLDSISTDVAELYLMGDIFDFWYEYKKVVPRGFTRILGRLADLTDQGIPVHFFTGNHDMWVYDYLAEETGITVYHDYIIREIYGKKFFLAHGDGLDASDKGYIFLKKIFTNNTMRWLFSRLHPNLAFTIAHKWSASSRLSNADYEKDFMANRDGMYKFAADFLATNPIDYFIMGHRHQLVNEKMNEKTRFVLLGDWIKSFSYGVFDGEKFELKTYKDRVKA
ncbi:UDP-2,3-diacylglucosamine diphosphatase [uncultured Draconibacterium sp.]|uniref:UDP-2,3-diacylglucosamine diphosphatase n=1 Tax=uncultured Draconibacterium sp. TaxID=1573823 RepID=UPI002AA7DDAE|nr:UDP-2,3-diacylglucosamine diphosphatase [uncultured Draconibacterium sp.]